MFTSKKDKTPSEGHEHVATEQRSRRNHRAAYPTPALKAFAMLLNVLALPLASAQLTGDGTNALVLPLAVLAAVGILISIYSNMLRPLPTNLKQRKILAGVSLAYGFFLVLALALVYLVG